MPTCLVVYFSRTGHTETVARALAGKLGADLEPIREPRSRRGFLGYWRSGREAMRGDIPAIEPVDHDPSSYDLVILGSPVWASHPSSPMSAFLTANADRLGTIACFVTLGGAGAEKTLGRIAEAAGKPPLATLAVTEKDLKTGAWTEKLEPFVAAVTAPAA